MKAYTFRVFNKAVRRARASRRARGRAPHGRDVDDDRRETSLDPKLTRSHFSDRRRGCACSTTRGRERRRYVADGHGAERARCRAPRETRDDAFPRRNRACL